MFIMVCKGLVFLPVSWIWMMIVAVFCIVMSSRMLAWSVSFMYTH